MRLPALLLVSVLLAALAVALHDPSEHLLGGVVVLAALLPRLRTPFAHAVGALHRPRGATVEEGVVPAPATS